MLVAAGGAMSAFPTHEPDCEVPDPLAIISRLRACWFDLHWSERPVPAIEARRDRIVARLHSLAVARLRAASRAAPSPRAPR